MFRKKSKSVVAPVQPVAVPLTESELAAIAMETQRKAAWTHDISDGVLIEMLTEFKASAEGAVPYREGLSEYGKKAYYPFLTVLDSVCVQIRKVDFKNLNDKEAVWMYDILQHIPKDIDRFISSANDRYFSWTMVSPMRGWLTTVLSSLLAVNQRQRSSRISVPAIESTVFPKAPPASEAVVESLVRIETLWKELRTHSLSAEDTRFLEGMVSSYLPDAWKLYQPFQNASPELREQAEGVLLQQYSLIEQRLAEMGQAWLQQNLQTMKAQVEFLEAKMTPKVDIKLSLTQ